MGSSARHVLTFVASLNTLLHTLCVYLLCKVYRNKRRSKVQPMLLLNLSVAELFRNAKNVIYRIILEVLPKEDLLELQCVISVFFISSNIAFILAMVLITVDRFAASILNIRYRSMCTLFRTKIVVGLSWFISVGIIPTVLILFYTYKGYSSSM